MTRKVTNTDHTIFGDNVAGEEFIIFFNVGRKRSEQIFNIFNEVGIKISHHATNTIIIECHTCATSLLHNIENLLTNAKSIEQHGCSTKVHTECTDKETVRSDTRKFIHYYADKLSATRHFDICSLFDTEAKSVVIVVCREIVETVHEVESLRVCEVFTKFLNSTMDIPHININLLDCFTVNCGTETEHTVSCRVLRTDVYNKIFGFEYGMLGFNDFAVFKSIFICIIALTFIFNRDLIGFVVHIIVLAERIADPVNREEQATHVGVVQEDDAVEIINFTFKDSGDSPQITNRGNCRMFAAFN